MDGYTVNEGSYRFPNTIWPEELMDGLLRHRKSFGGLAVLLATCLLLPWGAVTATDKATGDSGAKEAEPAAPSRAPAAGSDPSGKSRASATTKAANGRKGAARAETDKKKKKAGGKETATKDDATDED